MQATADRRQRDVDDADVEDDHELRQARENECRAQMRPLLSYAFGSHVPPLASLVR